MFLTKRYVVEPREELALASFVLWPVRDVDPVRFPTVARLLDLDDGLCELDRLDLHVPGSPLGHNCLYALLFGRARRLQLEVFGEQADRWHLVEAPAIVQTLKQRLHGYEEWYAHLAEFYGASYFTGAGSGESGYAQYLEGAIQAQEVFVEAVLPSAPFQSSLEFGCATGAMVRALRQRGIEAWGVDYSAAVLALAGPELQPYLRVGDVSALSDMPAVETVIGQEVFEHILPQQIPEVFARIHRGCRRWLMITVPCMPHDGLFLIEQFADLPKDVHGNPIQGHLVQASWYWWASIATLAGFVLEPERTLAIRHRWHENSRTWNLMVFRRCLDHDPVRILERLDELLRPTFTALRQDLSGKQINCGRLVEHDGQTFLACRTDDRPGYAYYGPYLNAGTATLCAEFQVRMPADGRLGHTNLDLPALLIEINSNTGIHVDELVSIRRFFEQRGQWVPFHYSFRVENENGIQVKLYYVGHVDLDFAWPVRLQRRDEGGGMRDEIKAALSSSLIPPPSSLPEAWVQGHCMRLHPLEQDRFLSAALAAKGALEPPKLKWITRLARPGDVVLDLGANIGYYTLHLARLVGPEGRVYAFEPDPTNRTLLRHNVACNGYTNVELVGKAVSDRTGEAQLYRCADDQGDHHLYDSGEPRPTLAVEAVALDDHFANYQARLDLLKIDVRGAEGAALRGMKALLQRHPRVKLITQFWPLGLAKAGTTPAVYLETLLEFGFHLFEFDEGEWQLRPAEPTRLLQEYLLEKESCTTLLCVKDFRDLPSAPAAAQPEVPCGETRVRPPRRHGDLRDFEKQVFSQNGEDGILEEIFRRLGGEPGYLVEFGTGTGSECNGARLVRQCHWQALFLEADPRSYAALVENYRGYPGVRTVQTRVSSQNLEDLLAAHAVPREFDLLSIDIDGNDYWVWAALRRWRPRVVVIEYNAAYPPPVKWVMKENPDHIWDGTSFHGASLASLARLGLEKGYFLVATNSVGINAFFVREDLATAGRFLESDTEYHYSAPAFGAYNGSHPPSHGEFVAV
jgi:FkbM family methyltransferase